MIPSAARGEWKTVQQKLRPFVARRVGSPSDVDDVLQEIFLRMQRGLSGLREDDRFGPWVYQVARSAIADHRRATMRHPLASDEAPEAPELEEPDDSAAAELAHYIAPFVAMLPSPYREALTLTELEGLTQKEAADMLGISLSGVKSRVQRGRAQLRAALEACCHIALDARGHVLSCEPRRPSYACNHLFRDPREADRRDHGDDDEACR